MGWAEPRTSQHLVTLCDHYLACRSHTHTSCFKTALYTCHHCPNGELASKTALEHRVKGQGQCRFHTYQGMSGNSSCDDNIDIT